MSSVLVVGSGGREHALAWKLSRSPKVSRVVVAPGNDAMPSEWERWEHPISTRADFEALAGRARAQGIDLAVIGPDNALADGIVDVLTTHGILCFGPSAAAAQIEASKAFAKDCMKEAGIPTARYFVADRAADARRFLNDCDWGAGWVIKADGLALGKGVHVCETREKAWEAIDALQALGQASKRLVIEERLVGEEFSWFAFCDGDSCALLEPARDHKRVFDGDQGPNTGGMGAFSPVPGISPALAERVKREVFLPILSEMKKRGTPFRGLLFAGLMIDPRSERFSVLEFNCRFGDPETQVLVSRMKDDLYDWCRAVAERNLARMPDQVSFSSESAVVVVGAARGYPETPEKGAVITGATLSAPEYFCAGVKRAPSELSTHGTGLVTNGGRVFGAMGMGATLEIARARAYDRIRAVRFDGIHFRTDIGAPGVAR